MSKLWADVKTIFQEISKHSDRNLIAASNSFIDYIGAASVDKLEAFPDTWSLEKKASYLFTIVATDRSKLQAQLGKVKFSWPGKVLITELVKYEMSKVIPTKYISNDVYDYLRLCRNVIKHWKKFYANVNLLKVIEKSCCNM